MEPGVSATVLAYIVAAIGIVIALLGVAVIASPVLMRGAARSLLQPRLLYGAVALRVVAGGFLIFASDACSWPLAVGSIGVVMLVAGLAGVFIGPRRLQASMAWFFAFSDAAFRGWGVLALLFGAFIVYAAV